MLSIIIPTLNEQSQIAATLSNVARAAADAEIVVADGGSTDGTRYIVTAEGRARWVSCERGRGAQMNAGASASAGDVLLFLHADTRLPDGAQALIARALADPRVIAGNFTVRFEPGGPVPAFFSWCYNIRSKCKVFYGDSAIFVRRDAFEKLGGYRCARIMEDLELVGRLRKSGRLHTIRDGVVISSSRRFSSLRSGLGALLLWSWLHILFYCGVSQEALERRYPSVR
jgi:rSAM/selenodomain-associated transferase 2